MRVCNLDDVGCDVAVFTLGCDTVRIYTLDPPDDGDDCDIKVYVPGPPGPPNVIANVGSRAAPTLITASIAAPVNQRQRSFIKGNGPVVDPVIANPSNNTTWELYLFATDDTDTVILNGSANLQLSGQWIGANGSMICLHWDGASQWVEDHRNEI